MSDKSRIEWTEATWNPVTGCDRVSPGCAHCYALALSARLKAMGSPRYQADGSPRTSGPGFGVTVHEDVLAKPFTWRTPRLVFVNSMSDLFHDAVPDAFISRVFEVMSDTPRHTYQVLTKRPDRLARLSDGLQWPANVWLGVSVENRRWASRVDILRRSPAVVKFISAEPLLGPIDGLSLAGIDWVIVGGESGPHHRPIDPKWVRAVRNQCLAEGVAFFFKQWGGATSKSGGRLLDGQIWNAMPHAGRPRAGAQ